MSAKPWIVQRVKQSQYYNGSEADWEEVSRHTTYSAAQKRLREMWPDAASQNDPMEYRYRITPERDMVMASLNRCEGYVAGDGWAVGCPLRRVAWGYGIWMSGRNFPEMDPPLGWASQIQCDVCGERGPSPSIGLTQYK